jgi:ketosteroid isomerase-like protein
MRYLAFGLVLLSSAFAHANETIHALETQFVDGVQFVRTADLERILADDFVYQHGSGRNLDRKTFIDLATTGGITVAKRGPLDLSFRDYGDTVISYGESTMAGTVFGNVYDGRLRFVNVWHQEQGRWRLAHRNSELLPHTAE